MLHDNPLAEFRGSALQYCAGLQVQVCRIKAAGGG